MRHALLLWLVGCAPDPDHVGDPTLGLDLDLDGLTADVDCDDGLATVGLAGEWYADADTDGFGDASDVIVACEAAGRVQVSGDCDDDAPTVFPGATEVCNSVDDDCSGIVDDDATDADPYYADVDGDSYGASDGMVLACVAPTGFVAADGDCDDDNGDVNPDATETCDDGVDANCVPGDCTVPETLEGTDFGGLGITLTGTGTGGYGITLVAAGDLDDGGGIDLAVGARGVGIAASRPGAVFILGSPITVAGSLPVLATGRISGALGVEIGDVFDGVGDIDEDGFDDVIVGVPEAAGGSGALYLLRGPFDSDVSITTAEWQVTGSALEALGSSVAGVGDMNGDGRRDMAVGASAASVNRGVVRVSTALLDRGGTPTDEVIDIVGQTGDRVGTVPPHDAGDLDQDGYDDLLVPAPTGGTGVYVVFGAPEHPEPVELSQTEPRIRHTLGTTLLGTSIDLMDDIDGDGNAEIVLGAPAFATTGAVFVINSDRDFDGTTDVATAASLTVIGGATGDLFGRHVAAGDLDGDGNPDVFGGAPGGGATFSRGGAVAIRGPWADGSTIDLGNGGDFWFVAWGETGDRAGPLAFLPGERLGTLAIGMPGAGPGVDPGAVGIIFGHSE